MEVDAVSRKGKGKDKSSKGKKGGKKGKEIRFRQKVTEKRQQSTRGSKVNVETAESMETKQLIVGTSRRPNLKVKARARESRNPHTEISESDSSKQVDETWTSYTPAQQTNLSQVNTIGCADDGARNVGTR